MRAAVSKAIGFGRRQSAEDESARSIAGGPAYDVRKLIAALEHPNPDVRVGAAHELGALGAHFGLGSKARAGSESSSRLSPGSAAGVDVIVAALIDALDDDDPSVRSSAALSLGECGAAAIGAIPALIATLAEADDDVRSSARIALEDIGDAARVPLQEALAHPDTRVRAEAEAILMLMGDGENPRA